MKLRHHSTNSILLYDIWITLIITLLLIIKSCHSLEFIRQYHTFPNNAARPKFIAQPIDQEIDANGKAQFKCAGEANPQPLLFWYKEGVRQLIFPPPPPPTTTSSASNSPLFNQLRGGGNPANWPQAAALVASIEDYSPSAPYGSLFAGGGAQQTTSDTSPAINNLFTMPISGPDQSPAAAASSYSNNYFGNRIYVDNQGTLNIVNATSSDNGYYACALISSVGSVLAKAKLTVRPDLRASSADFYLQDSSASSQVKSSSLTSTASSSSGKYDLLPPPVIKMGSANQTLPTNTSTILYCDVVSQVAYKIQWFIDNQALQEDPPRVTVLDSGALSINELKILDSGIYTCVVTAANDQNMPLSSPFEPLDSSMLTSAPPIQQSTAHSCLLKVANPINPNIQFFRMDLYAYPSSPGPAYLVSTNGDDAITIAWAPPSDSGVLPIRQYVVEHFDTSQEHVGWRIIHRPNGKESLLIDGLSSEGSHFFVIRATNSHGTGPSSAIAGPMRTVAGEARYQLEMTKRRNPNADYSPSADLSRPDANYARERLMTITTNLLNLTPVSSTSVRLQWSTTTQTNMSSSSGSSFDQPMIIGSSGISGSDFLEGYNIRFRRVRMGESLLGKDPLSIANNRHLNPTSLPLVTSYIDDDDESRGSLGGIELGTHRERRDLTDLVYQDYNQDFSEVRVADHNAEHYTMHGLMPFTKYQFFVVPYYKDIDGVPSNILLVQTNEDRPSVGPANLVVRPINNTAVRLLWLHIPADLANGIILGYAVRVNRSDIAANNQLGIEQQQQQQMTNMPVDTKVLNFPMRNLLMAPLTAFNPSSKTHPNFNVNQQFVVMCDLTNLTYKSFYSVQVAGSTTTGIGPPSESLNFVMDFKILSDQSKFSGGTDFDDVLSKSQLSNAPQSYIPPSSSYNGSSAAQSRVLYLILPILMIISILLIAGFLLYRRNNQKVITWKKTISEHFTNKFYMPSSVDHHHHGPNSIQHHQNIYDHQQHLIYSSAAGSTHMNNIHQSGPPQSIWKASNNSNVTGCLNSSGTGSLSSHGGGGGGGLLPINNDPSGGVIAVRGRDQILLMNNGNNNNNNNKDNTTNRFVRGTNLSTTTSNVGHQLISQASVDSSRSFGHHQQIIPNQHHMVHHGGGGGDYYSIINNVAEYEELDQQRQRQNNMPLATATATTTTTMNSDRHQTGSSNSDTSCPSSVTRLLPNQNCNNTRDLLLVGRGGQNEQQRHEMLLQQQIGYGNGDIKQQPAAFITMINGGDMSTKQSLQNKPPLSPYATTNLMNQLAQQQHHFNNQHHLHQSSGGGGFVVQNGGSTLDDASKVFMNQQMQAASTGGVQHHPITSFRTLQRNPVNYQQQQQQQHHLHQQQRCTPIQTAPGANGHQVFLNGGNVMEQHHHQQMLQSDMNFEIPVASQSFRGDNLNVANITSNPLADMKPNLYEHIDYNYMAAHQQQQPGQQMMSYRQQQQQQQHSANEILVSSSSTSSGSTKSPTQPRQPQQSNKFRRASGANNTNIVDSAESEAHDLRVFSQSAHVSRPSDCSETARQSLIGDEDKLIQNGNSTAAGAGGASSDMIDENSGRVDDDDDDDQLHGGEQVDETTAFRRKSSDQSDSQRARQLSKRKRQQQRNRLHNNNQKLA